jgi:hypothetical protein
VPTRIDPVHPTGRLDMDADAAAVVDRALDAAQIAADGNERLRLAKTLRRLAPAVAAASSTDLPHRDADADFEQGLRELARA